MLQHEYEQKLKLQEALEQLAKDQNTLERQAKKCMHVSGPIEAAGIIIFNRIENIDFSSCNSNHKRQQSQS